MDRCGFKTLKTIPLSKNTLRYLPSKKRSFGVCVLFWNFQVSRNVIDIQEIKCGFNAPCVFGCNSPFSYTVREKYLMKMTTLCAKDVFLNLHKLHGKKCNLP